MTKHDDQKPKQKGHRPAHHPKKVFDVTRPGKAPASPNSRSVIVGHKPQVHDDQFVLSEHWAGNPSEKKPLMDGRKKITLTPGDAGDAQRDNGATSKEDVEKLPVSTSVSGLASSGAPVSVAVSEASSTATEAVETIPAQKKPDTKAAEEHAESGNEKIDPKDPSLVALEHLMVEQVVEEPTTITGGAGAAPEGVDVSGAAPTPAVPEADRSTLDTPQSAAAHTDPTDDFWDKSDSEAGHVPQSAADELLAQTDAPTLEPQKAVVSQHHHHASAWETILIFLLVLLVGVIALNFLLDAGVIKTDLQLPHTDLIGG